MARYTVRINSVAHVGQSSDPGQPLLYVLRSLGLTAAKFGCGLGQCGTCTVLIDGRAAQSCLVTIAQAQGKSVTTLEGLGSVVAPHPVQAAFIKEQAAQCGYCTSGMIMSAVALLTDKPKPTEEPSAEISIDTDHGSGRATTRYCKVNVISSPTGIVTKLTTEDAGGTGGVLGLDAQRARPTSSTKLVLRSNDSL